MSETDESIVTARELAEVPAERHLDAVEVITRKLSLHLARAHAAVDEYAQTLRSKALGEDMVAFDTPLADAVGIDDELLREINALDELNIVTVGDLLECCWRGQLPRAPNFTYAGVVRVLAAVIRKALGG